MTMAAVLAVVSLTLGAPVHADDALIQVPDVQENQAAPAREGLTEADKAKLAAIRRDIKEDKSYVRDPEYEAEHYDPKRPTVKKLKPKGDTYLDLADAYAEVSNPRLERELRMSKSVRADLEDFVPEKYGKHSLFLVSWVFQRLEEYNAHLRSKGQLSYQDMRCLLAMGAFVRLNGAVWIYSQDGRRVTVGERFQSTMSSIYESTFVRKDLASRKVPKDFKGVTTRWTENDAVMLKLYGKSKYHFLLSKEGEPVAPLLFWGSDIAMTEKSPIQWGEADGFGLYDPGKFQSKIPELYRSDPRFLVAWLAHKASLGNKNGAPQTADYGITLMDIAMFAHENRHLLVTRPAVANARPTKVWHLFRSTDEWIGDILCNWLQMMMVFKMKPGAPTVDGSQLKMLADLAGSMNDMWDAADAAISGSKLCPPEPPK